MRDVRGGHDGRWRQRSDRGAVGSVMLVLLGVLALVAGGLVWNHVDNRAEERRLDAIVDDFRAPAGWTQVDESRTPARLLCLGGDGCPSSRIRWSLPRMLTDAELAEVVASTGWDLEVTPCPTEGESDDPCEARGTVDGFDVWLLHWVHPTDGSPTVSLTVDSRTGD